MSFPNVTITPGAKCAYEDCEAPATHLACGRGDEPERHPKPAAYCATHAYMVAGEGCPEYSDTCPNCGCEHGVN